VVIGIVLRRRRAGLTILIGNYNKPKEISKGKRDTKEGREDESQSVPSTSGRPLLLASREAQGHHHHVVRLSRPFGGGPDQDLGADERVQPVSSQILLLETSDRRCPVALPILIYLSQVQLP